jgi:ligand-binding sensor domain-containing protein/DNA-binding CsgD family transcriptional regulator
MIVAKTLRDQLFVLLTGSIFLLSYQPLKASSVKENGLPFITNYPKSTYNASTQNWSIAQNTQGFIYFGNNGGLLEFDGNHWHTYPIPNGSIIRSIFAVADTIYIGAFEECGYFAPNATGAISYHSLVHLIPHQYRSFDEIWKIHRVGNTIVFQSFRYLLVFSNNQFTVVPPPSNFSHSYQVDEKIYVVDRGSGLMEFGNNGLSLLCSDPVFNSNEIRCILPYDDQALLIGSINTGLFLLHGNNLIPWESEVNTLLKENGLFSAIRLKNGYFAFGSVQNGLYITDETGNVIQHLNRFRGLLNNTVLSLFEDKQNNLWLGLDNGIDFVEISSPISIFNYNFNLESTYTTLIFNDYWYVGTNQGLYVAKQSKLNENEEKGGFQIISGTEGQVWFLKVIDGQVFCGHNFGCFLINGYKAIKLSDERGFWTIIPCNEKPGIFIAGLYDGLGVITKTNGIWKFDRKIEGFNVSSKSVLQDRSGTYWISHGYRGLYSLKLNPELTKADEVHYYSGNNGLPSQLPYAIHILDDELVFSTSEGFFRFNNESKTFIPSEKYNQIFPEKTVYETILPDSMGNIWYFTTAFMGVNRLQEDGNYTNITAPFVKINNQLIPAFKSVFVYDNRNVFIGSQNGLIHYDPLIKKDYQHTEAVCLREIRFAAEDSAFVISNFTLKTGMENKLSGIIPFRFNSVSFLFASPTFESHEAIRFAYRLKGFDQTWSNWDNYTYKEYTNLPQGNYSFEVKSLNINLKESDITSYSFIIEPSLYRSKIAYVFYFFLFLLFVFLNFMFLKRRFKIAQEKENQRHEKELQDQKAAFREKSLMAERVIINLRNETLQGQVVHKNKELANTTQHLIHKNKILNLIKHQLVDANRHIAEESKKSEIEQVIRRINKDLKNEKFQDVFDTYFDDVHQDFVKRLKKKHNDLTPKDLRLCAYLRMNLSSKQIAPLMNISIRGVEIGRYRLRKKLNIGHEANLIEYLLSV